MAKSELHLDGHNPSSVPGETEVTAIVPPCLMADYRLSQAFWMVL